MTDVAAAVVGLVAVGARRWTVRPKIGMAAMAERISTVQPCTARDIKALEMCPAVPVDPRLRRVALAVVAVLGLDPVTARTEMGFNESSCGMGLEELRVLNPEWAANLDHLDALAAQRPPYWQVDGER